MYFGTPQYFSRKKLDFYRDSGCTKVHPEKNGVLEVVDDPLWSCDPTVQSVWLAVSKEVEEKGVKSREKKRKKVAYRAPAALCCWLFDVAIF